MQYITFQRYMSGEMSIIAYCGNTTNCVSRLHFASGTVNAIDDDLADFCSHFAALIAPPRTACDAAI